MTQSFCYSPPSIFDVEGNTAVVGLADCPNDCPVEPKVLPAVMPSGLAVTGLSRFEKMAALLPVIPFKLAGDAKLPPWDRPDMAGMGELLVLPAIPIKE